MASPKTAKLLWELAKAYPVKAQEIGFAPYTHQNIEELQAMKQTEASKFITPLTEYAAGWMKEIGKNYRWTSRQAVAIEIAYQTCKYHGARLFHRGWYNHCVAEAKQIGLQGEFPGLVFSKNVDGQGRVPLEMYEAEDAFRKLLSAVKMDVNARLSADGRRRSEPQPEPEPAYDPTPKPSRPSEPPKPPRDERIPEKISENAEAVELLRFTINAHNLCKDRNIDSPDLGADSINFRAFEDGAKLFTKGIPVKAIKSAMIQHWQPELKRTLWNQSGWYEPKHIRQPEPWDYDPMSFVPKPNTPGIEFFDPEKHHKNVKLMLAISHARVPGFVFGPSGTGKTTAVRDMAWCLRQFLGATEDEFPFGFLSMTRGTAPSAFFGRAKIDNTSLLVKFMHAMNKQDEAEMTKLAKQADEEGDVTMSIWQRIYTKGGVMLLDEIDAGDENLILTVNAAIANGHFANTATGEVVERHPDFIIWAAGNTNGMGANRHHVARNRLDHATLDRFREGRIEFLLDIERACNMFADIVTAGA